MSKPTQAQIEAVRRKMCCPSGCQAKKPEQCEDWSYQAMAEIAINTFIKEWKTQANWKTQTKAAQYDSLKAEIDRLRAALEWITEHHDIQAMLTKAREALRANEQLTPEEISHTIPQIGEKY